METTTTESWIYPFGTRMEEFATVKPRYGMGSLPNWPHFTGLGTQVYHVANWIENPPVGHRRFPDGSIKQLSDYQRLIFNGLGSKHTTSTIFGSFTGYSKLNPNFTRSG